MKYDLNEGMYLKTNKKIKMIGRVIMIIAFCMIVFGVINAISASRIIIPEMSSSNWFEISKMKSERQFFSTSIIMFGAFLEYVGCIVRFGMGSYREILNYQVQSVLPVAENGLRRMAPAVTDISKTMVKEMSPLYHEVAKEVASGIKEGIKE